MLIGLLRHGEVRGGPCFRGSTDDPLTPAGFAQMQSSTDKQPRWDWVISSPLARCAEFARLLARRHSLPLAMDARLREVHFGAWEGRTAGELMAEDPDALTSFWNEPHKYPPPGGEPLARFQTRVLDAWNDIINEHRGQRVLVITHGGVIRVVLCHVLDRPFSRLQAFEVGHGQLHCVRVNSKARAVCASIV